MKSGAEMTTDHEAFMRSIIADPSNDMPRLVFADWLEEHDEPERAEFIRCQIELAKMTEPKIGGYRKMLPISQSWSIGSIIQKPP